MGHAIGGSILKAKTKEQAMKEGYRYAEEFAQYNVDRQENPTGDYHGIFDFYNKTFDTIEEADEFFYSLGAYSDGVCMVRDASKGAKTKYNKKMESIEKREEAFIDKLILKFQERTSATVGCKNCGKRIEKEQALKYNLRCPNCREWLISNTDKQRLEKFKEQRNLAEEELKRNMRENGKIQYYAKYEVHC